jgi:hypothetical protein
MIIINDPNQQVYGQPINNNNSYPHNSYPIMPPVQPFNQPIVYNQPVFQDPSMHNNFYPQANPLYQQPVPYNTQPAYYNTPQQQGPIIIV